MSQVLTEVRVYKAKNQADAARTFAGDAQKMARDGWQVTAQSWAPGQRGCGSWLLAILLILAFGLGLLILAYFIIVKPAGTLTVTYTRALPDPA